MNKWMNDFLNVCNNKLVNEWINIWILPKTWRGDMTGDNRRWIIPWIQKCNDSAIYKIKIVSCRPATLLCFVRRLVDRSVGGRHLSWKGWKRAWCRRFECLCVQRFVVFKRLRNKGRGVTILSRMGRLGLRTLIHHSHPNTHIPQMRVFTLFNLCVTDGPMDQ